MPGIVLFSGLQSELLLLFLERSHFGGVLLEAADNGHAVVHGTRDELRRTPDRICAVFEGDLLALHCLGKIGFSAKAVVAGQPAVIGGGSRIHAQISEFFRRKFQFAKLPAEFGSVDDVAGRCCPVG